MGFIFEPWSEQRQRKYLQIRLHLGSPWIVKAKGLYGNLRISTAKLTIAKVRRNKNLHV
jgi:hypothetical protein